MVHANIIKNNEILETRKVLSLQEFHALRIEIGEKYPDAFIEMWNEQPNKSLNADQKQRGENSAVE